MNLRPNNERARASIIVFYILIVASVFTLVSSYMELNLLSDENNLYDDEALTNNDLRQQVVSVFYLLVWIAGIVFFLRWFRRAYYNLHQLDRVYPNYQEGWAVGAWFIPFINLFRPYGIMKEIWQYTQEKINQPVESRNIIKLWWLIFIISNLINNMSGRFLNNSSEIEDYILADQIALLTTSFDIIALLLIISIIRKISEWETILYNENHQVEIEEHLLDIE